MFDRMDLMSLLPLQTPTGRDMIAENHQDKLMLYVPRPKKWGGGRESKKITVNRFVVLDELFFEGLSLWVGEGGKSKGLYFGNSCPELLLRFLNFIEQKLGLSRAEFKVTLNVLAPTSEAVSKWSNLLMIQEENFTNVCVDPRINQEYAQVYLNSVVLVELMKKLSKKLEPVILNNKNFAPAFLKGLFAAEGQVALKKYGTLFYVSFSSIDGDLIALVKKYLEELGIQSGKYMPTCRKFPIYGYRNLKRFMELGIHTLHPEKHAKFEQGFAAYKRINVLNGDEARSLILQQLASGPKTYDDLAAALGKARTTIQAHHIPILEKQGLVKRAGKRGRAWMWMLVEPEPTVFPNPADHTVLPQKLILLT